MNNLIKKITKTGLIAGTLDILAASIYFFIKTGNNPSVILKYISSAIFGKAAFDGGNIMVITGLILHYLIAFIFTIFFFLVFSRIKGLSKNNILAGILYGIFIWVIMNLIVIPLSNIPNRPINIVNAIINLIILIVCVGIPVSFLASTFYKNNLKSKADPYAVSNNAATS